jgi:hypothetical protein
MGAFQEGYASEASVHGDVLTVPLIAERSLPRWLTARQVSSALRVTARLNLGRLAFVNFDRNDQRRWFDLTDARGHSLRLVFAVGPPTVRETEVLAALSEHVAASRLEVDRDTEAALSGSPPR